jgi:hypothetical protein
MSTTTKIVVTFLALSHLPLVPTKKEISDGILADFGTRESNDIVLGAILICGDVEDSFEPSRGVISDDETRISNHGQRPTLGRSPLR